MTTTVSQEAREAAANLWADRVSCGPTWNAIRQGKEDDHSYVQAFAKFEQSIRQSAERGEVVAWMYERKGPWPARYFHDKRTPAYLDEGEGWTETALYAFAQPEESGR